MPFPNYRTLIIDDEPKARCVLRSLIGRYCPQLTVCAEAGTVPDALAAIQEHRPELIFLDVDLGRGNGFEILDAYPQPGFQVIFVTAHDDFAVKAFRYRALHYLLKPIDPTDLIAVTNEIQPSAGFAPEHTATRQLPAEPRVEKLLLPTLHGTVVIRPEELSHFFASEKYATAVLENGEKIFISLSLRELEESLPASTFIRPHQSYLVRIDAVRKILKTDGITLVLKDKTKIPVSRKNKALILELFG